MQQYYSNVPSYPSSIKKLSTNVSLKDKYTSHKDLQRRSKSNANHSGNNSNLRHTVVEKPFYHKQNKSSSKFYERAKEVNQLNFSHNVKVFDSNASLNASHVNLSLKQIKKRTHSESFSVLPRKNKDTVKIREKTLEGIKLNFSQEKIKLMKMVTVKVNQPLGLAKKKHQLSLEGTHNTNESKNILLEKSKAAKPFKLYTEGNTNCPTSTHNESLTVLNTSHLATHNDCTIQKPSEIPMTNSPLISTNGVKDLEQKLLARLSLNKNNSKSKKYNTLKGVFEEMIKAIPADSQAVFLKLLSGYHEVVSAFANENKGLRETNEILQNKLFHYEKTSISDSNALKAKEKEIEQLKAKIAEIERNPELFGFSRSTNTSTQLPVSSNEKELQSNQSNDQEQTKNSFIININKENLGDLDALYFFNKVQMNTEGTTQHCIPALPINTEEAPCWKKDNPTKLLYANILGKLKQSTFSTVVPPHKAKENPK